MSVVNHVYIKKVRRQTPASVIRTPSSHPVSELCTKWFQASYQHQVISVNSSGWAS